MKSVDPAKYFVDMFLNPLLIGGKVHVGLPIQAKTLQALQDDVTIAQLFEETHRSLQRRAAALLLYPPEEIFDESALLFSVALHQVLFAFHAVTERGKTSAAGLQAILDDAERLIEFAGVPQRVGAIVGRHLLLEGLLSLKRRDESFSFRFDSINFYGETPEWRRIPLVRAIQHHEARRCDVSAEMLQRGSSTALFLALSSSPLSALLRVDLLSWRFRFDNTLPVLLDPQLCRLVTNALIDRGLGPCVGGLGAGLKDLLRSEAPRETLLQALRFTANLVLSANVWREAPGVRDLLNPHFDPKTQRGSGPQPQSQVRATQEELDLNHEGWAIILTLMDRQDLLQLPTGDLSLLEEFREGAWARILPSLKGTLPETSQWITEAL